MFFFLFYVIINEFISEIFISAPYEGTGVLYVFSGKEITSLLNKDRNFLVQIHDLKDIQVIENADFKALGISLQSLVDIDKDGGKGKVILYMYLY